MRYFDRFSRRGGPSGLAGGDTGSRRDDSPWLSFLYPRLILARELLREDGALFVSIDDRSIHHLRYLLDEIFGPDNHAGTVVWRKGRPGKRSPAYHPPDGIRCRVRPFSSFPSVFFRTTLSRNDR